MTQATATQPDPLTELERLEQAWQEAAAQAADLGRDSSMPASDSSGT